MSASPSARPSSSRKAPSDKPPPPPQPPRPLALFGCTHGELYAPPLPSGAAVAATTGTQADAANATAAATAKPPTQPRGSYATLASRMRAMGWKVDLLTDFERQLLPPLTTTKPTTTTTTITIAVLGAPSRRFSRAELQALRRFLLERGGRLWLLAEGADPAGPAASTTSTTNLWRRLTGPVIGIAPRAGEAVVRLSPWPSAPPLLARAVAAALEVAAAAEDEEEQNEDSAVSVRRACASLRRVRRAAATSGLCLHPRHALVSGGGGATAAAAATTTTPTTTTTILNRSVLRAFLDPDADPDDEPDASFVFANGCPLDVFVEKAGGGGGAGTATPAPATPLLWSGRQCYPMDRLLMAAWEQQQPDGGSAGGRALVVGSAAMFSDAWIGGSSSNGNNRCDGNRRLADWCLRWLSAPAASTTSTEPQLDADDAAAARAAMGVSLGAAATKDPRRYRRPPHALLPATGALASRVGAASSGGGAALPSVSLPPAAALRGDWRAMLDRTVFDGGFGQEGGEGVGGTTAAADDAAAAAAALLLLAPLS